MPNIVECIKEPIQKMTLEEKGLLNVVLTYGKKAKDEIEVRTKDPNGFAKWLSESGSSVNAQLIKEKLGWAFQGGFGIGDEIFGRTDNYGVQLEYVIDKVLVKSLKISKPYFKSDVETYEGAYEREKWITEKMLESMWNEIPEEAKKEIIKATEKMLKEKGIDKAKAAQASAALFSGGFTLAKSILGFQFHIILAQISNLVVKAIIGRGLSVAANALLQKLAGIFFGPIGWIITAILLLPTITGLLLPREFDKYIPAVFLIGMVRLRKEEEPKPKKKWWQFWKRK